MSAKLPVQISLDFTSSTKDFKQGYSEISKNLSTLSRMYRVLDKQGKLSIDNITKASLGSSALAHNFVDFSQNAVNSMSFAGSAAKDFFNVNYINQYVNSLNEVTRSMGDLLIGFKDNKKQGAVFANNMLKIQRSTNPAQFKKFATSVGTLTRDLNKFSPV